MTKNANEPLPDLEHSMKEIQALVEQMEKGDNSLEQSLTQFERGVVLIKHCQRVLQEAEQKVQILMQADGAPVPFQMQDEPKSHE